MIETEPLLANRPILRAACISGICLGLITFLVGLFIFHSILLASQGIVLGIVSLNPLFFRTPKIISQDNS